MNNQYSFYKPAKLISGGQKGADLGGLAGAKRAGIKTGGHAPKGFLTEVGPKPCLGTLYQLIETDSPGYPARTRKNVENADATMVFSADLNSPGTKKTIALCMALKKPYLALEANTPNVSFKEVFEASRRFLNEHQPATLNVAGNRESKSPGLTSYVARLIHLLFEAPSPATLRGDLIKLGKQGKFDVIIHGCNCFNTMGAGFAKSIKKEFPQAFESDQSTTKGDARKLGDFSEATIILEKATPLVVVNAYTQYNYGKNPSKIYCDYEAIRNVFRKIKTKFTGKRIGYPLIGGGLANGDWKIISQIINEELWDEDHSLVILPE